MIRLDLDKTIGTNRRTDDLFSVDVILVVQGLLIFTFRFLVTCIRHLSIPCQILDIFCVLYLVLLVCWSSRFFLHPLARWLATILVDLKFF